MNSGKWNGYTKVQNDFGSIERIDYITLQCDFTIGFAISRDFVGDCRSSLMVLSLMEQWVKVYTGSFWKLGQSFCNIGFVGDYMGHACPKHPRFSKLFVRKAAVGELCFYG